VLCVREQDGACAVYKGTVDEQQLPKALERLKPGEDLETAIVKLASGEQGMEILVQKPMEGKVSLIITRLVPYGPCLTTKLSGRLASSEWSRRTWRWWRGAWRRRWRHRWQPPSSWRGCGATTTG
jgi:hypothetical protein